MDASCSSASNRSIIIYYKFNKMKEKVTLVVVDFQYDFCLLGAPLYVPGSDKALWNISHLIENNKVGRVIFTADLQRDEAMTRNSDYDIAFIRKGKETSGTAQNILRRWTK